MTIEIQYLLLCLCLGAAPACGLLWARKRGREDAPERRAGLPHLLGFTALLLLSVLLNAVLFDQAKGLVATVCLLYAAVALCVLQLRRIVLVLDTAARLLLYPWYLLLYGVFHWSFQGVSPFRASKRPPSAQLRASDLEALLHFLIACALALGGGAALLLALSLLLPAGGLSRPLAVLTTLVSLVSLSGAALYLLRPETSTQSTPEQEEIRRLLEQIEER